MSAFDVSRDALKYTFIASALLAVSACSSGPIGAVTGVFSKSDEKKAEEAEEEAQEESERISILALEEQLSPDPRYAG
ncbi:MAG: hypothetical protein KJN99_13900, partial [Marinicaulis sp.]|nr:hypothetical protein [Marinicaulis sp.]